MSVLGGRSKSSPAAPRAFFAAVPLATMMLSAGCTCGSGPYEGDYFDGDRPAPLKDTKFAESEKSDPKLAGCADGQREGCTRPGRTHGKRDRQHAFAHRK